MNHLEIIAIKQIALDHVNAEYDKLLDVLERIANGTIDSKAIVVDKANRGWKLRAVPAPAEDS